MNDEAAAALLLSKDFASIERERGLCSTNVHRPNYYVHSLVSLLNGPHIIKSRLVLYAIVNRWPHPIVKAYGYSPPLKPVVFFFPGVLNCGSGMHRVAVAV